MGMAKPGQGPRFPARAFRSVTILCGDDTLSFLAIGVRLSYGVTQSALPESVNVSPAIGMNCQS